MGRVTIEMHRTLFFGFPGNLVAESIYCGSSGNLVGETIYIRSVLSQRRCSCS